MKNKLVLLFVLGFVFFIPAVDAEVYVRQQVMGNSVESTSQFVWNGGGLFKYSSQVMGDIQGDHMKSAILRLTNSLKLESDYFITTLGANFEQQIYYEPNLIGTDWYEFYYDDLSDGGVSSGSHWQIGNYDAIGHLEEKLYRYVSYEATSYIQYLYAIYDSGSYILCEIQSSSNGTVTYKCPNQKSSSLKGFQVKLNVGDNYYGSYYLYYVDTINLYNYSNNNDVSGAIRDQTEQQHKDSQAQLEESKKQTAQQKEQLEEQKKQTDFITSDADPDTDISALGNVTGIFPPGPADSLLNIPFKFLSVVTSSFGGVCKPIETGIWNGVSVVIPCFSEIIYSNVPEWLMIYMDIIPAGYILIRYFKYLYKKIDRATSLDSNSDDEWGVL